MDIILILDFFAVHLKQLVTYIQQNMATIFITALTLVLAFDDKDTCIAVRKVLKMKIKNKVVLRNIMFESTTTTKGHADKRIGRRYAGIFIFTIILTYIDNRIFHQSVLSTTVSILGLSFAIIVKNQLNRQNDLLKRNNTSPQ